MRFIKKWTLSLFERPGHPFCLRGLLGALSSLFRLGVSLRHQAYDKKFFTSYASSLPVVSIGNIVVGGTGKTPLVQLLAEELGKYGKVGILSRGFKGKRKEKTLLISQGKGPLFSSHTCGDEPFLLAQKTTAWIWVGKDRSKSAKLAEEAKRDLLLLDDGMQHRKLARDFEIVVVQGQDPLGGEKFLPLGKLREDPRRLSRADLIVFTHVKDPAHYVELQKKIAPYSQAPSVGARFCFKNAQGLRGVKVAAFCGIGNPASFYAMIEEVGGILVHRLTLPDHEVPLNSELEEFIQNSCLKGATQIVCTEKDEVKLGKFSSRVTPLRLNLEIVEGQENWTYMLEHMKQRMIR